MQGYYAGPLYKIAAEAIEREVFRRLARGEPAGRLKLVAAHTHRTWKDEAEVRELFAAQWQVELLERRDILAQEPGFRAEGVSALSTAVYRLQRR